MIRTLIIVLSICHFTALGQGPTFKSGGGDWAITGGAVILATGSTIARFSGEGYDINNLPVFDPLTINQFDRKTTNNWSPKAAKHSDILGLTAPFFPALLFLDKDNHQESRAIGQMYFQSALLTLSMTDFTKRFVQRARPLMYADNASLGTKGEVSSRYSFFSGHTSMTASQCMLTAKIFSELYPDSDNKKYVWAGAILYPAVVGYLRVRSGKHFPTDVIVGYLVGGLIGYLTPHFHLKRRSHD
jgi:membrane-associated phospholipid phosphatase